MEAEAQEKGEEKKEGEENGRGRRGDSLASGGIAVFLRDVCVSFSLLSGAPNPGGIQILKWPNTPAHLEQWTATPLLKGWWSAERKKGSRKDSSK